VVPDCFLSLVRAFSSLCLISFGTRLLRQEAVRIDYLIAETWPGIIQLAAEKEISFAFERGKPDFFFLLGRKLRFARYWGVADFRIALTS